MMAANNRKPAWFFYPGWVAATVLGMLIAWWLLLDRGYGSSSLAPAWNRATA